MKTIKKYLLFITILVISICIVDLLNIDQLIYKVLTGSNNYDLPFWDALIAIGTVGTIIFALLGHTIEKIQDNEDESEKIINNLRNEIFINFDQLQENGLASRDFIMETRQLDILLENSRFINLEAEGVFRPLRVFYTSAKRFNERIGNMHQDGYFKWNEIKKDCIKHMLHIFSLCSEMSFDEVEKSMTAIENFCSRDKLEIGDFDELKNELPERFWKLNEFKYNIKRVNKSVDFDGIPEVLLRKAPISIDLLEQKDTVLNFLIERLANLKNVKKVRMKQSLENSIRSLVKSV
jgi:hypothetical protein